MVNTFINSDCVSAISTLPASSVDLVVTSPPYNLGMQYASYDDRKTQAEYEDFADSWISVLPQIMTPQSALWLNVGCTKLQNGESLPLTYTYYPILKNYGFSLVQEIVWHASNGMAWKKKFSFRTERWMWCVRDIDNYTFNLDDVRILGQNKRYDKRNNKLGKNPTDYWYFNRVVHGCREKTKHPCQFPCAMLQRIIRATSNEGDTILDPFGGSGSTAFAASKLNRDCISIEMDPTYHQIAVERNAELILI